MTKINIKFPSQCTAFLLHSVNYSNVQSLKCHSHYSNCHMNGWQKSHNHQRMSMNYEIVNTETKFMLTWQSHA